MEKRTAVCHVSLPYIFLLKSAGPDRFEILYREEIRILIE